MSTEHLILSILLNLLLFTLSNTKIPDELNWTGHSNCFVYFPLINTSFNVCNLKLPNGFGDREYYEVRDYRYTHHTNTTDIIEYGTYYYHFNIGAPVLSEHAQACHNITSNPGYCSNITGMGMCAVPLTPIHDYAYAYQLRNDTATNTIDDCWRLSNSNGGPPQWSLYYPQNPTEGIKLQYRNGDFLHDGPCPINRKFTIAFLCENEFLNVPDTEPMYESETCDYTLEIPSIYGCPIECKIYNQLLCSGHGLCGYDFTNMQPRCFCYHNRESDDCSRISSNETTIAESKLIPPRETGVITFAFAETDLNEIINITYDLTPMGLKGGAYNISDLNPNDNRKYRYFIGLFDNIDMNSEEYPESCRNVTAMNMQSRLPCVDINMTDGKCNHFGEDYSQRGYAFQYDPTDGWCSYLGTEFDWELYDKVDDPARGITINYKMGTWCPSRSINRGMRISLICPDDAENFTVPDINEEAFVFEDTEAYCEYSMEIQTTIACPYQCRTSKLVNGKLEYSVCSEHGICVADPNAGFVRCLCDDGWKGIECGEIMSPKPSFSPTMAPTQSPTPNPTPTFRPTESPTPAPTLSPTPTAKPTRYPTVGVKVHNVTVVIGDRSGGQSGGVDIVIIVVLALVLVVVVVLVYFGYKKFKQREQILLMKLEDKYQEFGNNEAHDITKKKGVTAFTTIDDHIAKDSEHEQDD